MGSLGLQAATGAGFMRWTFIVMMYANIFKTFDVVLNEWGFDLLKLDFLYAAAVRPIHNRTRGEVMCDAMDLVRKLTGNRMMLACGVPMMPAFGKADFAG